MNLSESYKKRISELAGIEPEPVNVNRFVYHLASDKLRERINNDGIVAYRGFQWLSDTKIEGNAVFATNSDDPKDWFESTWDDDVWKIDTTKISEIIWYDDPNFSWGKENKHIYTKSSIPRMAIELIKEGTGEDLLESTTSKISDLKFDVQGNTINFTDSLGGYGFLVKNGEEIKIVNWNSVPLSKKYSQEEPQYKQRGFARKVIQAIKDMGYKQFTINMPSNEATAALNKLSQDGFITPIPESKRGISVAPYYTRFTIN